MTICLGLQTSWLKVTGTPLRPQRVSPWIAAVLVFYSLLSTFLHIRVSPHLKPWKTPLYACAILQILVQVVIWHTASKEITRSSLQLRQFFRHRVRHEMGVDVYHTGKSLSLGVSHYSSRRGC